MGPFACSVELMLTNIRNMVMTNDILPGTCSTGMEKETNEMRTRITVGRNTLNT